GALRPELRHRGGKDLQRRRARVPGSAGRQDRLPVRAALERISAAGRSGPAAERSRLVLPRDRVRVGALSLHHGRSVSRPGVEEEGARALRRRRVAARPPLSAERIYPASSVIAAHTVQPRRVPPVVWLLGLTV